jgi:hypothetical protein
VTKSTTTTYEVTSSYLRRAQNFNHSIFWKDRLYIHLFHIPLEITRMLPKKDAKGNSLNAKLAFNGRQSQFVLVLLRRWKLWEEAVARVCTQLWLLITQKKNQNNW